MCWFLSPTGDERDAIVSDERGLETCDFKLHLMYYQGFYNYRKDNPTADTSTGNHLMRRAVETKVYALLLDPSILSRSGHPDDPSVWTKKEDRSLRKPKLDDAMERALDHLMLMVVNKIGEQVTGEKQRLNRIFEDLKKYTRASNKAHETEQEGPRSSAASAADRGRRGRSRSPLARKVPKVNPMAKQEMDAAYAAERTRKGFKAKVADQLEGVACRFRTPCRTLSSRYSRAWSFQIPPTR